VAGKPPVEREKGFSAELERIVESARGELLRDT